MRIPFLVLGWALCAFANTAVLGAATCPERLPCLDSEDAVSDLRGPHYACAEQMGHIARSRLESCTATKQPDEHLVYLLAHALVRPVFPQTAQKAAHDALRAASTTSHLHLRWLCFAALGRPWNVWGVRPEHRDCDGYAKLDPVLGLAAKGHVNLRAGRRYAAHRIFRRLESGGHPSGLYGLARMSESEAAPGAPAGQRAFQLYAQAAQAGDPLAILRASALQPAGEAIRLLEPLARQGNPAAQVMLAVRLSHMALERQVTKPTRWRELWSSITWMHPLPPESREHELLAQANAWAHLAQLGGGWHQLPGYHWAEPIAIDMSVRIIEMMPSSLTQRTHELVKTGQIASEPNSVGLFHWLWTDWESSCIDATTPCQVPGLG